MNFINMYLDFAINSHTVHIMSTDHEVSNAMHIELNVVDASQAAKANSKYALKSYWSFDSVSPYGDSNRRHTLALLSKNNF